MPKGSSPFPARAAPARSAQRRPIAGSDASGPTFQRSGPTLTSRRRRDGGRGPAASRSRMTHAVDVSIVVVSWNTRDDLRNCLASVLRETADVAVEVFVVDNAS